MAQIITKFIADNAVDDKKVRLPNGNFLRGRNQANTGDINIFKINGSDRVEFGQIPQYPAGNPSPVAATDITSKAYVDSAIAAGSSQFYRDPVLVVDTTDTVLPSSEPIDGQSIPTGTRVLFTALTVNPGYVYVATNTAGSLTWTIAADNDPSGAPLTGDTLWVKAGTYTKHQLTYNGTAWVVTGTDVGVESGDSITVTSLGRLNISLTSNGGLVSSNPGNPGGTLGIQLQTSNPTLFIDGSNHLGVRFSTTTSGLQTGGSGLAIQLEATNPTMQIDGSNQLGVKLDAARAITTGASGIGVNINPTNPTLKIATNLLDVNLNAAGAIVSSSTGLLVQVESANPTLKIASNQLGVNFSATVSGLKQIASGLAIMLQVSNPTLVIDGSNQLGVKFSTTTSGLQAVAAGLAVQLEASNPTLAIDGSNQLKVNYAALTSGLTQGATGLAILTDGSTDVTTAVDGATGQLRTPKEKFEVITLSSGDITNQYKDLGRLAQLNSVEVIVAATEQTSGVDYTVSTVGGVSRVTFTGDLATGGNAALVAGDVLYVRYRSYTA